MENFECNEMQGQVFMEFNNSSRPLTFENLQLDELNVQLKNPPKDPQHRAKRGLHKEGSSDQSVMQVGNNHTTTGVKKQSTGNSGDLRKEGENNVWRGPQPND